jgi:hypothetical protein
MDRERERR